MNNSSGDARYIYGAGGALGGKGGGGGGARTPSEAADTLNSTSYVRVVDLIGEGELEGFATPAASGLTRDTVKYNVASLKDIFVENVPVLKSSAVLRDASYSQNGTTKVITVTCSGHGFVADQAVRLDIVSGTAASDDYKVTAVTNANVFTCAAKNTNTTTGNAVVTRISDYNFRGFSFAYRYGLGNQTYIAGFGQSETTISVGLVVEKDVPIARAITNENVEEVKVIIRVPVLQFIKSNGDIVGDEITLAIEVSENGGDYKVVGGERVIKGRTPDAYERTYSINTEGYEFPIELRVRRITDDSTSAKRQNSFVWSSYTEVVNEKLSYPHSALVACRIDAAQFNRVPDRAYRKRGRKVRIPSNATVDLATGALLYNDQPWLGDFGAAQWTNDPAWCLWDLLTNVRYGTGEQVLTPEEQANFTGEASRLDKWAFYAASRYCSALDTRAGSTNDYNPVTGRHGVPSGLKDTAGNDLYEPRFSCNVNIQTQEEVFNVINDMCSVFRSMPFWNAGSLTVAQDRPVDPSYIFNTSNVADAGFSYSSASQKTKPNVAIVAYLNLDSRDTAYEQVEDVTGIARNGSITTEITAFGCTSRGQARRVGEWLLYSNSEEAETITFTTSLDAGIVVRPGQVIGVNDPTKAQFRRGGRVASGTTTVIEVDSTAEITAGPSQTMTVVLPTGLVETRPISTISGTTITVASGFSQAPAANAPWSYSSSNISTSYWRVVSLSESDGVNYSVVAIKYNSSKYDYIERDVPLQPLDITDLNEPPAGPTLPVGVPFLEEALYEYQATVYSKIIITWTPVLGVYEYLVRWTKDSNNWNEQIVTASNCDILETSPGLYEVEVYSLNPLRRRSVESLNGSINALGKTAPPSNVTGLIYSIDPYIGAILSWDAVGDIDLSYYEIRRGDDFGSGTLVTEVKATTYKLGYLDTGAYTYHIKAVDTSGIYSSAAGSETVEVVNPGPAGNLIATVQDPLVVLSWDAPVTTSYAITGYRIKQGPVYNSATELAVVQTTSFSIAASWTGGQTFWVAPIDYIGQENAASSVVATVDRPSAPTNGSASFAGDSVTLAWTASASTATGLSVQLYEIRYGNGSYESATPLSTTKSTSFTVKVDWSGSRTFLVKAIDANGNDSTSALSIVATTIAPPAPTVTSAFAGREVVLSWNAVAGNLLTSYYVVSRQNGASFTELAKINSTSYTLRADWVDSKQFQVKAVSSNGEEGTVGGTTVVISPPSLPTISQQVIDNNVLLRWNDVTGSVPIEYYVVKRSGENDSYSSATEIGTKQGLFTTVFETAGATYRYWVAGVDSAGNEGPAHSVVATVNQPPDYILLLDQDSTFAGSGVTKTNAYAASGLGLLVNVATGETWQSHFTNNGATTLQNFISSGFTHYLMPTPASGSYEEIFDYGGLVGGAKVSAILDATTISGSTTIDRDISVRTTASGTWTVYSGVAEVYATNFRYVRLSYRFTSSGGDDLLLVNNLNLRLDSKLKTDAGTGTAFSGDASGTTVSFNESFIDVQSITVTPASTSPLIAVYNFVDAPNPTDFKVLLFTPSGVRTDGTFSWTVRGV